MNPNNFIFTYLVKDFNIYEMDCHCSDIHSSHARTTCSQELCMRDLRELAAKKNVLICSSLSLAVRVRLFDKI